MITIAYLNFVQRAVFFFSVTADKRNRIPVFEHLGTVLNLPVLHRKQASYMLDI